MTNNPPFDIYIDRIDGRKAFKLKDGYKLELKNAKKPLKYKKVTRQHKKLIDKTKNGENEVSR